MSEKQNNKHPQNYQKQQDINRKKISEKPKKSTKKIHQTRVQSAQFQTKLQQFMNDSNALSKQKIKQSKPNEDKQKIVQLENKIKNKEQQIKKLNVFIENTVNGYILKQKQQNKKTQQLLGKSVLKIALAIKKQKYKIDPALGYFTDQNKKFIQGYAIDNLKSILNKKIQLISKLEQQKKIKSNNISTSLSIQGAIQFFSREIQEIKVQIQLKNKQMQDYKDRLRLDYKQQHSQYYLQQWPIIYQKYQTLQLLGSGGFGQVYKCFDLVRRKQVAVKRIKVDKRIDPDRKQQFFKHVKRQIQIQKNLVHPNIAKLQTVLQLDVSRNCVVFELQYCSGPQLSRYIRKHGYIVQRQAKIIIKQIFCALSYLSTLKQKIIHYDLKPGNIIFHNGVIKILDFGLSKIMEESDDTRIDLTSQGVGTYYYLPPEAFDTFEPKISSKLDVWSAGVIFFQMLYGKKPFGDGMSQNHIYSYGIIQKAKKVEFPTCDKKQKISQGAKQFIQKCLAYDADKRLTPLQAFEDQYLKN